MLTFLLGLMRILSVGVINFDLTPCSKFILIYNIFCQSLYIVSAFISIYLSNLRVNYDQNTLTRSGFWIQYVGRLLIAIYISINLMKHRNLLSHIHKSIIELTQKCEKFNKKVSVSKPLTLLSFLILCATFPIIVTIDCLYHKGTYDFFIFCSCYMPGILLNVFITYIIYLKRSFSGLFEAVNAYLNDFYVELSWQKRIERKSRKIDAKLNNAALEEVIAMHKTIFELHSQLTTIYNISYLFFILLCMHGIILFTYTTILDLIKVKTKQHVNARANYFTEYWILMYLQEIFAIVLAAHQLKEHGNATSAILHSVRSIYHNLNEHASVYSFYLMHTEVNVNAAGLFEFDYATFFAILGVTIKYVFILLQFDRGGDEYAI